MQIYTHLMTGLVLGAVVPPRDHVSLALAVAGSILPDLVMIPEMVISKIQKRKAFERQSPALILAKEISHSLILWTLCFAAVMFIGKYSPYAMIFCVGGVLHIIIDILTHCGTKYRDTDQTCCYPFDVKLGSVFGIWEYRYDHGVLKPKPAELVFDVMLLSLFAIALIVL